MAYGPETHTNSVDYEAIFDHSSGVRVTIGVDIFNTDGTTPSEATRDSVFQATLNRINGMAGVTFVSAVKDGNFTSAVTPA